MKNRDQNTNWIVDAVLFTGLCIVSIMDLTGLTLHQWMGLAVGVLAGYHLLSHWTWVKSVTLRFKGRTSAQARRYYFIDASLLIGFSLILISGLVISTWFDFTLSNYAAWRNIHVVMTIVTLVLVVIKVGIHWRWVVKIGQRILHPGEKPPGRKSASQPLAE